MTKPKPQPPLTEMPAAQPQTGEQQHTGDRDRTADGSSQVPPTTAAPEPLDTDKSEAESAA